MPKFIFQLHDEVDAEPAVLAEMLESNLAAVAFGEVLLAERPNIVAVEVLFDDARITTIKRLGHGQTASTPIHASQP